MPQGFLCKLMLPEYAGPELIATHLPVFAHIELRTLIQILAVGVTVQPQIRQGRIPAFAAEMPAGGQGFFRAGPRFLKTGGLIIGISHENAQTVEIATSPL